MIARVLITCLVGAAILAFWQASWPLVVVTLRFRDDSLTWLLLPLVPMCIFLCWSLISREALFTPIESRKVSRWRLIDLGVVAMTLVVGLVVPLVSEYGTQGYTSMINIVLCGLILALVKSPPAAFRTDIARFVYLFWILIVIPSWDMQP